MITNNASYINSFTNPVRRIDFNVNHRNAETNATLHGWASRDAINEITYSRVGVNNKFYGYGICQKINLKLRDKERAINPTTKEYLQVIAGSNGNYELFSPYLYITECHRDEITNELSITAYDNLYNAAAHTVAELEIEYPATIADYATAAAAVLGNGVFYYSENAAFNIVYENGANLEGTETIRDLLDAIAEATQTIYYISRYNTIIFKTLDLDGIPAYTIDKEQYFTLDSGENRRLAAICHTNELGNSVEAKLEVSGTTQYIRNNPFFEMRDDAAALVENALSAIGGLTINQFECEWRGNPAIEIGDKIALTQKDNTAAFSYLLDDVFTYDGTLKQVSKWKYENETAETENNPSNLGEALKQTYARVDKVNKQIDIVASESETNSNNIAALQLNTNSIAASVSKIEETTNASFDGVNTELATLTNKVDAAMTAEGVKLSIQEELANGVDKVYTSTGFSFDADGLRVSKTGSEMESLLDEDGLTVFRDNVEVLTADNTGVNGINMTVRQYLIVGGSRFEAYGAGRTGCFWID